MTTMTDKPDTPTPFQLASSRLRYGDLIKSGDPQAREKLKERIGKLTSARDAMKAINAAVRLKPVVTGNEKLKALGLDETAISIAREKGRMYLPWQLTNLNQNIARLRKRLEDVEAEAARGPVEDIEEDGYRIVENTELGRIQFLFETKPDADTRSILKRNGFRWAPSKDAWQRHLNDNGRYAVQRVRRDLKVA